MQWRHHMLSTTCKFVLLQAQMPRYWFALGQREKTERNYCVRHRSCFQRMREVTRLIDRMGDPDNVSAAMVDAEYRENFASMVNGPAQVTLNFVDTCKTVQKRRFSSPVMRECLRDLDDRAAYARRGHIWPHLHEPVRQACALACDHWQV